MVHCHVIVMWLYAVSCDTLVQEREREKEAREEEMALLQRMKEADLFKEWESQEDDVRKQEEVFDQLNPFLSAFSST